MFKELKNEKYSINVVFIFVHLQLLPILWAIILYAVLQWFIFHVYNSVSYAPFPLSLVNKERCNVLQEVREFC